MMRRESGVVILSKSNAGKADSISVPIFFRSPLLLLSNKTMHSSTTVDCRDSFHNGRQPQGGNTMDPPLSCFSLKRGFTMDFLLLFSPRPRSMHI